MNDEERSELKRLRALLARQRAGLDRYNAKRQRHAEVRAPLVRWYYEFLRALNPKWPRTKTLLAMSKQLRITDRSLETDLAKTARQPDLLRDLRQIAEKDAKQQPAWGDDKFY